MSRHLQRNLSPLYALPLAVILLSLALCLLELPVPASAQTSTAIGQILVASLPQLGDLPGGYNFKSESAGLHDLSEGSANSYTSWWGQRPYTWYVPSTKYNASSYDFIRISGICNYREGINDSYAEWSPEKFRAVRMTWDEKGQHSTPYDGLPGGVITSTVEEDSNGAHLFSRIYFWKSRYYNGDIYIQYTVTRANNNHPETPPYASRLAEGKAFYLTQIERLAKLTHSRLPEGQTGGPGATPAILPPPIPSSPQGNQPVQTQPTDSTATSGEQGRLPDAALPVAAGATAVVAGLGALAVAFSSGVNPKEAVEEVLNLFRGQVSAATEPAPVEVPAQTTFDQAAYDKMMRDENLKQLQDDVDRAKDALERRQQYIDGLRQAGHLEQANTEASTLGELQRDVSRTQQQLSNSGGQEATHLIKQNTFDIGEDQMAKVRAEAAAGMAGKLTDLERVKISDWIDMQAPDDQTAQRMRAMVDDRTVTLGDGKAVGSFEDISRELGQMLQQGNQPDLSYVERFSIRDEFMDNAKTLGNARGYSQDGSGTAGGLTDITKQGKLKLAENTTLGGVTKSLDAVSKVSDAVGYIEGYTKGAGNSVGYAAVKAAAQMGVKQIALSNPVIGLGDTAIKYAENALLGRDASPGKALETMVNLAFDAQHDVNDRAPVIFNSETGQFEVGARMLGTDSPELTEPATSSMLSAVDKQLGNPNLSAADKEGLMSARTDLLETLKDLRGQQ
jgi:hypothetical protein